MNWRGLDGTGAASHGTAVLGTAWLGVLGGETAWSGKPSKGNAGRGEGFEAVRVRLRQCGVGHGEAGITWPGTDWHGAAGSGMAWTGLERTGRERRGLTRRGIQGKACQVDAG